MLSILEGLPELRKVIVFEVHVLLPSQICLRSSCSLLFSISRFGEFMVGLVARLVANVFNESIDHVSSDLAVIIVAAQPVCDQILSARDPLALPIECLHLHRHAVVKRRALLGAVVELLEELSHIARVSVHHEVS